MGPVEQETKHRQFSWGSQFLRSAQGVHLPAGWPRHPSPCAQGYQNSVCLRWVDQTGSLVHRAALQPRQDPQGPHQPGNQKKIFLQRSWPSQHKHSQHIWESHAGCSKKELADSQRTPEEYLSKLINKNICVHMIIHQLSMIYLRPIYTVNLCS